LGGAAGRRGVTFVAVMPTSPATGCVMSKLMATGKLADRARTTASRAIMWGSSGRAVIYRRYG